MSRDVALPWSKVSINVVIDVITIVNASLYTFLEKLNWTLISCVVQLIRLNFWNNIKERLFVYLMWLKQLKAPYSSYACFVFFCFLFFFVRQKALVLQHMVFDTFHIQISSYSYVVFICCFPFPVAYGASPLSAHTNIAHTNKASDKLGPFVKTTLMISAQLATAQPFMVPFGASCLNHLVNFNKIEISFIFELLNCKK